MKRNQFLASLFFASLIVTGSILTGWVREPKPVAQRTIVAAVSKSIPVLQVSGDLFINKVHCASCHHSLLTSQVIGLARQKGIPVEDSFAAKRVGAMLGGMQYIGDPNKMGDFLNVPLIMPYTLMALAAEKIPPNVNTDIGVSFLLGEQNPDGSFPGEYARAPFEYGQIHVTALSLRGIQLYVSPAMKPQADARLARTKTWLENVKATSWQELDYQLLGLHWSGSVSARKQEIAAQIVALQQPDGGWSQIASLKPDAFATGLTLFALQESGMLSTDDPVAQRGIAWLLKHQQPDGEWIVEARSYLIQPFVSSGFPPLDENQFISAAATNWATLALLQTLPDKGAAVARQ